MKYRVEKIIGKYFLIENKTDFVIKIFKNWSKARELMVKLNNRGGFEGETPSYFINKSEQKQLDTLGCRSYFETV